MSVATASLFRYGSALLILAALLMTIAGGQEPRDDRPASAIVVLHVDGVIGPATADFIHRGLVKAQSRGARLVVLQMDTPGGLDESMRRIIKEILASPVPVATYVAPEGARAASAGTYILYASHIAAMAPATNLGAATPVSIGGTPGGTEPNDRGDEGREGRKDGTAEPAKDSDTKDRSPAQRRAAPSSATASREKAVNDAAAYIRGLAQLRGRNAEFAEQAVLKASSLSSSEALKGGVIDVMATSISDLVRQLDGRSVVLPSGKVTLALAGAPLETLQPDWRTRVLGVLSNPMLAMVLMMVGVYGLFVEFTTPGFGVPGVAGAIALLMALYAFNLLPVNWAGVALLALGAILMIAEVFLPSFGALGVGGIIAFIVGGLMMFDSDDPSFDVGWPFVVGLALVSAASALALGTFAVKSRRRPVVSGREDMVGAPGKVIAVEDGNVWAEVHGERWLVTSSSTLRLGDRVRVDGIHGLTLNVTQVSDNRS